MKISFVLPPLSLSGGIKVVAIYADHLRRAGHEVFLVSPPPRPPSWREKLKSLVRHGRFPAYRRHAPSHLDELAVPHRVLDRHRPPENDDLPEADVIVATWWETAEWIAALAPEKGARAYFVQHHEVVMGIEPERARASYRLPFHKIVIARWLHRLMAEEYGDSNCDLVPNAVDREQFTAPPRGRQAVPTVGFLYHHAAFKGVDVALAAVRELKRRIPALRAICFGEWPPIPSLALDDWMEFHRSPPQDRIRDLYASCDVWITASRSEGFNLPAMEAMACRTPLVATRTGWPEEAVRDMGNGLLVAVDDTDAIVRGVERILSLDDDDWRRMSQAALDTVADSSWQRSAEMFEAALRRAVDRAGEGCVADAQSPANRIGNSAPA